MTKKTPASILKRLPRKSEPKTLDAYDDADPTYSGTDPADPSSPEDLLASASVSSILPSPCCTRRCRPRPSRASRRRRASRSSWECPDRTTSAPSPRPWRR